MCNRESRYVFEGLLSCAKERWDSLLVKDTPDSFYLKFIEVLPSLYAQVSVGLNSDKVWITYTIPSTDWEENGRVILRLQKEMASIADSLKDEKQRLVKSWHCGPLPIPSKTKEA